MAKPKKKVQKETSPEALAEANRAEQQELFETYTFSPRLQSGIGFKNPDNGQVINSA